MAARRWARAAAVGWMIVAMLAPGSGARAQAERLPPAVVAIVDYDRVTRDALAAKSIASQMQARQQAVSDEVSREERRLAERDAELGRQKSILDPEVYQERRRAFQDEVAAVQRTLQRRMRALDDARTEAFREIEQVLLDVIGDLAENYGFNIVLPSSRVLVFTPNLDLTEDVLGQLDARLPRVELPTSMLDDG